MSSLITFPLSVWSLNRIIDPVQMSCIPPTYLSRLMTFLPIATPLCVRVCVCVVLNKLLRIFATFFPCKFWKHIYTLLEDTQLQVQQVQYPVCNITAIFPIHHPAGTNKTFFLNTT